MGEPKRRRPWLANFFTPTRDQGKAGPRSRDVRHGQDFDNGGMTTSRPTHPGTAFATTALAGLSLRQLAGRRDRLERELAQAFGLHPLPGALIERLVEELTMIEREIDALQAATA